MKIWTRLTIILFINKSENKKLTQDILIVSAHVHWVGRLEVNTIIFIRHINYPWVQGGGTQVLRLMQ